ncbi:MAG TPA: hypothetical protein PKD86_13130, partial [Gemmatales bacterium]|nr:hypothetical protein [Gemmatales bacterium]
SAQELAADLRRFLANEPIQARPVGPLGRHSKWVRRQPLLAVLTYACFLVFVLALWEWREATRAQSLAEQRQRDLQQERDAADAQRQRAEAEALRARRFYYAADVNLAQQAMTTHQGQRLLAILERQVPEPGQTDLRTFEWHYLHGRTRTQSRAITLEPGASLDRMVAVGAGQQLLALVSGRREGKGFLEVRLLNAQDGTELQRWPSAGVALDVSLDGTLMAYSAGSNEVLVRRLADGEMVLRLPDMGALVSHVAFAPGGDLLAVVSMPPMPQQDRDMAAVRQLQATRMVRFFSMKGETVSVPLQTPGTSFFAVSVAFAPDGKHFVVGGAGASISQPMPGGIVALFDWPSGQLVRVHSGLPAVVPRVHFTPDGTRYAAASGSTLLAWETADGTERLRAAAHADAIHATALARSAPLLVTADLAGATMLWNLNGGRRLFAGYGHSGAVHSAAFLHGDQQFVTGGADGRIAFWSTSPPQSELTLHLPTGRTFPRAAFQEATFSPSGQTLATMDVNDVVLWDSQTWTRKSSFRIAEREVGFAIVRLLFTPAEDAIVAMGSDGQGSVWSLTGQKLAEIKMPPDEQGALQFNAAGTHLLGRHQRWRISDWRVEPVAEPGPVPRWCSPDGKLALAWERDQAFNADGTATRPHEPQATGTSEVLLFETETGRIRWRWSLPARQLQHAAFSRTGDQVAIGAGDGRIWVYDVGSGGVRSALKGHLRAIWSLAFAPDGQTLASASLDGTVRLWDPHIGQERLMFKNDPLVGGSVAFAPDGRTLAIGWGQNPLNPIRSATTTVYVTVPLAPNLTPLRPAAPAQPPISLRGPPGTVRPSR